MSDAMFDDSSRPSAKAEQPVFLVTTENALGRSSRWVAFGISAVFGLLIIVAGSIGGSIERDVADRALVTPTRDDARFAFARRVTTTLGQPRPAAAETSCWPSLA